MFLLRHHSILLQSSDAMKALMKGILTWFAMTALTCTAVAADRFVSTLGTVQREISADRVMMSILVRAADPTVEGSNAKLEQLIPQLYAEMAALNYPTSTLSLNFRETRKVTKWDDKARESVPAGFESMAAFSVNLIGLTNYGKFVTFLGTRDGFELPLRNMSSSAEGEARKRAIAEALRVARAKAELLAEEGGARLGQLLEVTEEEAEAREFPGSWGGNARDPNEGTGAYPLGIFVRVRAKFELETK